MIALRNESAALSRRTDAKIGLLKEIIERIKNGEEVDVEGLLGAGDKEMEREWEEGKTSRTKQQHSFNAYYLVLQEIEREDQAWAQPKRSKPKRAERGDISESPAKASQAVDSTSRSKTNAPSGFY